MPETANIRQMRTMWGEELDVEESDFEPTIWAHIGASEGDIWVATERINGVRARAQVFGRVHPGGLDYVGDVFEFGVDRSDSIEDVAAYHLQDAEQAVEKLLDEVGARP